MKFLILAHPRSGTRYAAALLQSFGFEVGHEQLGKNGIASWFWGLKEKNPPYEAAPYDSDFKPTHTILLLREPLPTISSVAYTEFMTSLYRETKLDFEYCNNQLMAMYSIYKYNELVRETFNIDAEVKTENLSHYIITKLGLHPVNEKQFLAAETKTINTRPHPEIDEKCIDHQDIYHELVRQWKEAY